MLAIGHLARGTIPQPISLVSVCISIAVRLQGSSPEKMPGNGFLAVIGLSIERKLERGLRLARTGHRIRHDRHDRPMFTRFARAVSTEKVRLQCTSSPLFLGARPPPIDQRLAWPRLDDGVSFRWGYRALDDEASCSQSTARDWLAPLLMLPAMTPLLLIPLAVLKVNPLRSGSWSRPSKPMRV